jgi:expansin (peptidoglycan-binding protein)
MNNGANPNANPLCGKTINIYYNGNVHQARIFDTCPTCAEGSLDLSPSLFQAVAPNGDGRVHGVSWSLA